jgi:hypothetical protein
VDIKMQLEDALEIKDSPLWSRVVKELQYRIDLAMAELRHCTAEQLPKLQIRIDLLEEVIRLPQDIIDREST